MWWNDSIDAATLSWASITPFGVPGRAAREDELEHLVGFGALPGGLARLPVGREERVVRGGLRRERLDRRRREVGEAGRGRVGRVTARAQDQVAGPRRADDGRDRVRRHPQVERHDHEPGVHRPEVGGRQLRARRAPGQDPIAGLQVERPQPPGGDPRAAIEIAVRPVRARAIVRAQAKRRPIAEAGHGALEQVDQGHRHGRIPRAGRRMLRRRRTGRSRDIAERRSGRSKRASGAFDPPETLG